MGLEGAEEELEEALGSLAASGGEAAEYLESISPAAAFVATGEFAADDSRAQLAFGQIVGGGHSLVLQESKEMIGLFGETIAYAFLPQTWPRLLQADLGRQLQPP